MDENTPQQIMTKGMVSDLEDDQTFARQFWDAARSGLQKHCEDYVRKIAREILLMICIDCITCETKYS